MIDNDEKLEHMCPDCRDNVLNKHTCTRCGKELPSADDESFTNPNFDIDRYNSLLDGDEYRVIESR